MKARIVERTKPDSLVEYVIQQKHLIMRWQWVDAWINCGVECQDTFKTLEEAKAKLCWFDGTETKERVLVDCCGTQEGA